VAHPTWHLAIDLGAGSGRAILGRVEVDGLTLREVHRFSYEPQLRDGHLRWDMERLRRALADSLGHAGRATGLLGGTLSSVGVDSWAVDYGLLDAGGCLLEDPICYRDARTSASAGTGAGVMDAVFARVPRDEIFRRTGIQFLPFNTIYQLAAHAREGLPPRAARLLMMPDLCHQELCGSRVGEFTNASTTQLLNLRTGQWDDELFARLALPRELMPDLVQAGDALGMLRPALQAAADVGPLRVIAPATHDTGSAIAGAPLAPDWAYISSGTWSLVGVERTAPLVGDEVARANFTNEGGACGTVRFLKNVMGLWIVESCRREWERGGLRIDHDDLLERVAAIDAFPGFIFPDDPRFFNPASMTAELRTSLRESGQAVPDDPVRLMKVVLDSLALRYASVLATIERLTGCALAGVHVIGGGARNAYLNQATADAANRPVRAGPVEATAAGNVTIQAIACGEIASLAEARQRQRSGDHVIAEFAPRRARAWAAAAARYAELETEATA
jgi:rhamnulokinase